MRTLYSGMHFLMKMHMAVSMCVSGGIKFEQFVKFDTTFQKLMRKYSFFDTIEFSDIETTSALKDDLHQSFTNFVHFRRACIKIPWVHICKRIG